ncbi:endoribonuclease MazF [Sporosarcina luteola]|uniref:endoribonuclease MazF n=1 Tax=Sporosarcina luteola TaxID=582850 RepID=UPI00203FD827|nr:endoribonuclease MazF [Sporosarcina luteola]MCM3710590.1 endoribonuclease MazF [Sporosarcina luteola]
MVKYVPERGDLIWLSFSPQSGAEQAGRRPAIVLSPSAYNEKSGLVLVCPVTSKQKGYPFEVMLKDSLKTSGTVLSDQVLSLDWRAREASFIEHIDEAALADILENVRLLLD